MTNSKLTKKQMEDVLHIKFHETIFKMMVAMKKHTVKYCGESYSATEIHVIDTIGRYPQANVTELAGHQGVTKSAISQKLKKLEDNGFILRRHSSDNAKEVNVELTELGWKAFHLHDDYHKNQDKEIFEFINNATPGNLSFLIEGFKMINGVMDRHLSREYIVLDLDEVIEVPIENEK